MYSRAIIVFLLAMLVLPVRASDLVIYTYDSFMAQWGPGPRLEAAFEAQCDCDIEFVALEDGVSILNRARIEQSNTHADILLGLDNALTDTARQLQLVQPHQLSLERLSSDLHWQDDSFVPFDYGYFAFIYDDRKIRQPAASLQELINSSASVIYQDPRTSTPGQGLLLWVNQVYPAPEVDQAWQQLAQHTVTVTKGWWEAYSMFLKGDADYVLSYHTSPVYHRIQENNYHYRAAVFSEGHPRQIEVAALSRFSRNPERARQFLHFLLSAPAQALIAQGNWMLPVVDDVTLPADFQPLISPATLISDPAEVARKRREWIRVWRRSAG